MRIGYASCDNITQPGHAWLRMSEHAVDVFVSQGDTPYANAGQGAYGYTTTSAVLATTQAQMLDKYRQFWAKPSASALLARRASHNMLAYYQPDDHEWGGDNWDHTVAQANASTGIGAVTQADVNLHWKRGNDAHIQFLAETWDNPTPDAAGNTQRPSQSIVGDSPPTTDYPIRYFHRDFSTAGVLGGSDVRLIFIDCLSYRSPIDATDNSAKVMLGAQQEAWLVARVAEATSFRHVLIFSTKTAYGTTTTYNTDTYRDYNTERDRILAAIDATGVPIIWLSGDRHCAHVVDARKSRGAAADFIDICACPAGVAVNGVGRSFAVSGPRLEWIGGGLVYGLLTIDDSGLLAEIRSVTSGAVQWSARFAPRSNVPGYPAAARTVRLA